jgi:glycosyltransferase involved in cell wall biosynthesis
MVYHAGMDGREPIIEQQGGQGARYLFIEPYLNGSHRALAHALMQGVPGRWTLLALPGRFFRWRMRGGAAFLAEAAGDILRQPWDALLCSSMLNLAELRGLVPELARVPALVYFHENQLAYPAAGQADAGQRERDLFLAFSNLTSAAAAQLVAFNSAYHRDEVIAAANDLLNRLPDAVPMGLVQGLLDKSRVLPVPLMVEEAEGLEREPRLGPLRLIWNHRWSQDKDPDALFAALDEFKRQGGCFEIAILGRKSGQPPAAFQQATAMLGRHLVHMGPVEERRDYWRWLFWADVCISTALQEYQGLAVAEAAWAGCRPLVPDALVYPQLYPDELRYDMGELAYHLAKLAAQPELARQEDYRSLVGHLAWTALVPAWKSTLEELCSL